MYKPFKFLVNVVISKEVLFTTSRYLYILGQLFFNYRDTDTATVWAALNIANVTEFESRSVL